MAAGHSQRPSGAPSTMGSVRDVAADAAGSGPSPGESRIELLNRDWRKVGGSSRVDCCLVCGLNVLRDDPIALERGNVLHAACGRAAHHASLPSRGSTVPATAAAPPAR